jgi:serine protease Do
MTASFLNILATLNNKLPRTNCMKKILLLFFITISSQSFAQNNSSKPLAKIVSKLTNGQADKVEAISPKQVAVSGFADIVEELLPAVVNISATQEIQSGSTSIDQTLLGDFPKSPLLDEFRNQLENQFRGQQGKKKVSSIGSGFIISKDGFIVTNSHVVDSTEEITISLNDGSKYKAKIIGIDKKTDLALLKINTDKELKFVKFGDSDKARIGDWIIIIGNPYGLGGSVSAGIVSARSRDISNGQSDDFIQTDAAINKGNSGGPMFNLKGEVIGISTAIFSPSGGNIGIGFARPSATASQVIKQLKEQGEVTRGWLGVSVQDVTDEIAESMKMEKTKGAFVVEVAKDGPADKAGILPTDIIIKFDDQEITEMKILPKTVAKYPVGKSAKVTLLRRGSIKTLTVKVSKMKDEETQKTETKSLERKQLIKPSAQILGLGVVELNANIKKSKNLDGNVEGLLIVDITAKSEAAEKGIAIGDIILSANQAPIKSVDDLKQAVENTAKSTKKLFLFIRRGDNSYAVVLTTK